MSVIPDPRAMPRRQSSTRVLRRALASTGAHYRSGSAPTVRHLLAPLGGDATALAAALLALPFLLPVSLGPVTSPASLLIGLLGWRLLRETEAAPLPRRLLDVSVPQAAHRAANRVVRRVHRWVHRISRPRLPHLVAGRRGRLICAWGIMVGAVLLAVPIPLLPLTNTFPALAVLLFTLGWLERDGLLTVLGAASVLLSVLVFAALGTAVTLLGWEAIRELLPRLPLG